ncbi:hypothetical protein M427DRAFT_49284 [Gonapodya prolifera JEL478]|uniref:Uncharacterized protein n=1 Tax=Gonapodya prolifera (strain JEL478) TaxID=1344416 RepID=A0A138ZYS8_GONPJ|nr:hypothetical protein M427DRAFT_49284 [Gonapodya prolifera JEL478]|eukprot:KXS09650.1 hypothetical protein M427DRAFT_49284 [Gonapodya prolifera JEL478]
MTDEKNAALIEAIEKGDAESVRQLLDDGADPNVRKRVTLEATIDDWRLPKSPERRIDSAECESALALAIMHGNAAIAGHLLEKGADPNTAVEWKTPSAIGQNWKLENWDGTWMSIGRWRWTYAFPSHLALAISGGGTRRLYSLLNHGATITDKIIASAKKPFYTKFYALLNDHDVERSHAKFPPLTQSKATDFALLDAIDNGNEVKVHELLKDGANPNVCKRITTLANIANSGGVTGEVKLDTGVGESALALAIIKGYTSIVHALAEEGVDLTAPIQWSVPAGKSRWFLNDWEKERWAKKCAFPSALHLATAIDGTVVERDGKPRNCYDSVKVNMKGGYVRLDNPDASKSFTLKGNLDIIKLLLSRGCGAVLPPTYVMEVMQAVVDIRPSYESTIGYKAGDELLMISISDDLKYGRGFAVFSKRIGSFPLNSLRKWANISDPESPPSSTATGAAEANLSPSGIPAWHIDHQGITLGAKLREGALVSRTSASGQLWMPP